MLLLCRFTVIANCTCSGRDKKTVKLHTMNLTIIENISGHSNSSSITLIPLGRKEGNVLFNDALNTFYLRLYGVRHMVKDHSDSEKENPLPPHRLLFPISSKGSFICTIPQTG